MAAAAVEDGVLDANLVKHGKRLEDQPVPEDDATNRSYSDTHSSGASSAICTGRGAEESFLSSPHSAAERESGGESPGSSSDDATLVRPGALTPAILNLLLVKPGGGDALSEAVDELTEELHHHSTQQALHAPQLHALSKESLDVLRAERIARRMERAQAPEAAQATDRPRSQLVATPVNDVSFNIDGSGAHAKKGKCKSARATRIYMAISPTKSITQRAVAGEPPLRAECEPAPANALD